MPKYNSNVRNQIQWQDFNLFKILIKIVSTFNKLKSCHCIWFCTLLSYFDNSAYLFSPDEGSCYILSTRNNCCEILAHYGVIIRSFIQSISKYCSFNNILNKICVTNVKLTYFYLKFHEYVIDSVYVI